MKRAIQLLEREINGKPAFICLCHFLDKHIPDTAGFRFNYNSPTQFERVWYTFREEFAARLSHYATGELRTRLSAIRALPIGSGQLIYDAKTALYIWIGDKESRSLPSDAGFTYDRDHDTPRWITTAVDIAARLAKYADDSCRSRLFIAQHEMAEAKTASRALHADIEVPVPQGLSYLGYQLGAIAVAAKRFAGEREHYPGLLIADEMGCGKTIEFIGILNYFAEHGGYGKSLIIPPAGLRVNWLRELEKWLVIPKKIVMMQSETPDWKVELADIIIVNYDIFRSLIDWEWSTHFKNGKERPKPKLVIKSLGRLDYDWDFLACDEAHVIKHSRSQRAQFTLALTKRARRSVYLTGSPIVNFPAELFTLIHALDPTAWPERWKFENRYCAAFTTRFGRDTRGGSNLDELESRLRSTCMVRRLKADVLSELPPKRYQIIEIDPGQSAEARAAIREELAAVATDLGLAEDEQGFETAARALEADDTELSFSQMSLARHRIGRATLPFGIAHLKAIWEEVPDKKIVAWGWHQDVLQAIADAFPGVSVLITGAVSSRMKIIDGVETSDRMQLVDRFNNDPTCILCVGQIQAAGVGLNMTVSSHHVFIEQDFRPSYLNQATDRSHRIGQLYSLLIQHLVLMGSFTARMIQRVVAKQSTIRAALGDTVNE